MVGFSGFFGSKATVAEVKPTAEELAIAPVIAAARGIVSRSDEQRERNVNAVCEELTHARYVRAQALNV